MVDPQALLNGFFPLAWAAALWRASWQGGLALLLVWIVCRACPAVPPRLRVWLWRLAYLKLMLVCVWTGALTLHILPAMPYRSAPRLASQPSPPAATVYQPAPTIPLTQSAVKTAGKAPATPTPTTATSRPAASPTPAPSAARRWPWADLLPLLGVIWILGVVWGVSRLLLSMRLVRRLRRQGHPLDDEELLRLRVHMVKQMGLRKVPMLLAHPTAGPLLLGMVHPVIIVPEAMLAGNKKEELQLALAHELAHVCRRDILWGWLPVVAELLFFFHPLLYPARREYRLAQEIAADAAALHRTGVTPKAYGAMLVNSAVFHAGYRPVPVAVGIMESFQLLSRRLTALKHLTFSPGQHVMAGLLVGVLALVGLVPWRLSAAENNDFSRFTIPPPEKMPMPNARDLYLQASDKLQLHIYLPDAPPYEFRDILEMSRLHLRPGVDVLPKSGRPTPTLPQMQALMQANQPAFALLRQGLAAEYREDAERSFKSMPHNDYYAKCRNLARIMMVDSYTRACAGDWNGALGRDLDSIQLGISMSHGSLMSMRAGDAFQFITRHLAWEAIPHLSEAEAGAAARRLEMMMANTGSLADLLQRMKWDEEARLIEVFQTPNWRQTLPAILAQSRGEEAAQYTLDGIDPQALLTNYDRYMEAVIAYAKLPYATPDPLPTPPNDPITPQNPMEKIRWRYTLGTGQNALLLTALALQAHHARHHEYPDTLTALMPAYLNAIPTDPFGAGELLHYRRTEKGYLLYSIGPDGKDDGGVPSIDGQPATEHPYSTPPSTGDIVAGVNIQ